MKGSYKVDLRALHALCEANYARMLRLFSDYESRNSKRFTVDGAQVHIEVLERSRYTTLFCLKSYRSGTPGTDRAVDSSWLMPLAIEVRAYHDAGMIEVVRFQTATRTQGRYAYPNPSMHQQDEKNQQNCFLADWLSYCLHHGQADLAGLLKPGAEHA
ncbi:MAG: DUF1249 domain-containing protein [Congregibacter sp.]|nr:DUF1249 domain-containing protein [Congregibacter sp.]MDP5071581.1 DUF1249 domain-containing protein [Congregibacter sp.]